MFCLPVQVVATPDAMIFFSGFSTQAAFLKQVFEKVRLSSLIVLVTICFVYFSSCCSPGPPYPSSKRLCCPKESNRLSSPVSTCRTLCDRESELHDRTPSTLIKLAIRKGEKRSCVYVMISLRGECPCLVISHLAIRQTDIERPTYFSIFVSENAFAGVNSRHNIYIYICLEQ